MKLIVRSALLLAIFNGFIHRCQGIGGELSGPDLVPFMKIGTRVVRGKDWKWDIQDGGPGGVGSIISEIDADEWVLVKWDTGKEDYYRMGSGGEYDLELAPTTTTTTMRMKESSPAPMNPSAKLFDHRFQEGYVPSSGPELVPFMTIGARVVRGLDWEWGDQDGGPGGGGSIIDKYDDYKCVVVEWDSGDMGWYRVGDEGKYDLMLAPIPTTTQNSTTTEMYEPYGPDLILYMKIGARVVRGEDWEWGDQDGGPGNQGSIVGEPSHTQWVHVKWDNGEIYSYRMGNDNKYDLLLAPATSSDSDKRGAVNASDALVAGPELAALIKNGTRVVRGRDWQWGDQDGGPGKQGVVVDAFKKLKWVKVRWDSGESYWYRIGTDGKYDLKLAPLSSTTTPATTVHVTVSSTWKKNDTISPVINTSSTNSSNGEEINGDQDGQLPISVVTIPKNPIPGRITSFVYTPQMLSTQQSTNIPLILLLLQYPVFAQQSPYTQDSIQSIYPPKQVLSQKESSFQNISLQQILDHNYYILPKQSPNVAVFSEVAHLRFN